MKKKLKFKFLLDCYRSKLSELEYVEEVFSEASVEFEIYKKRFCSKKQINIPALNHKHTERLQCIFTPQHLSKNIKDNQSLMPQASKKIFRQIARKFHPDKLSADDPLRDEYTDVFKKATAAVDNHQWSHLVDIAEKYGLDLDSYESINELLLVDIKKTTQQIDNRKNSYAWMFYHCERDEDKDKLMKKFLNFVYINYTDLT